jgi:hypothetical protein
MVPPLLALGLCLAVTLYYLRPHAIVSMFLMTFAATAYGTLGNFAAFYEVIVAVLLDGNQRRLRLLPISFLGSS